MQRPHTLTISANVSLPRVNEYNEYSFESTFPSLFVDSNMIMTITDPPSFSDQFSEFWNVYGSAISLVAGVAGGFSGWVFAKLEKGKR